MDEITRVIAIIACEFARYRYIEYAIMAHKSRLHLVAVMHWAVALLFVLVELCILCGW